MFLPLWIQEILWDRRASQPWASPPASCSVSSLCHLPQATVCIQAWIGSSHQLSVCGVQSLKPRVLGSREQPLLSPPFCNSWADGAFWNQVNTCNRGQVLFHYPFISILLCLEIKLKSLTVHCDWIWLGLYLPHPQLFLFLPCFPLHCLQASCSFLVSNKARSYLPRWLCVPFFFAQTYPGWLISSLFQCTATEYFTLFLLIPLCSSFMPLWTSLHFAPSYDASHPSSIPSIKHNMWRRARSTTQGAQQHAGYCRWRHSYNSRNFSGMCIISGVWVAPLNAHISSKGPAHPHSLFC